MYQTNRATSSNNGKSRYYPNTIMFYTTFWSFLNIFSFIFVYLVISVLGLDDLSSSITDLDILLSAVLFLLLLSWELSRDTEPLKVGGRWWWWDREGGGVSYNITNTGIILTYYYF